MTTSVTVEFGSVVFTGAEIKSARVVEEIDPIAIELPINTIELTLISTAGEFSIINPSGFFAGLQYKQPLDVYENFDGVPVYLGRFYLDEWESLSENEATFRASDAIGVLESKTCLGWEVPNGILQVSTIISRIETETGVSITIDSSFNSMFVGGWVPVTTYREALQQLCFVLGAYATCARSNEINIIPIQLASELLTYDHTITASQKGLGQPIILLPLVTAVDVDSHFYTTDEVNKQVFEGTLPAGTHRVVFDGPKWTDAPTLAGATNVTAILATNYMDLSVAAAGTVTLSVADFVDSVKTFSVAASSLPASTVPNIIKISDATLVSHTGAGVSIHPRDVAQRVYSYYQQRYLQKARLYAQQVAPGDSVLIESQGAYIAGIIERMETDLARGFVSQVEIVGVVVTEIEESMHNLLINGGFDFAQRQAPGTLTTITQDTYSADRWRISRENTNLQYQRNDAHAESGLSCRYYGSFKKITSTGKLMVYQIVEGLNSAPLKGKTVVFQARMKASAAKTIRMAVIELQNAGTMDTIPATFVSAWGANSTDPTLGSNLAIITGAQSKSVTTAWQNFSVSVTVPSNSKNIIVALWSDSQFAANDILHIAEAGLYISNTAQIWKPRPSADELLLCQRHYWKTFGIDTAPVQNAGLNTGEHGYAALTAGATSQRGARVYFPVLMFAAPTITTFNPSVANAQIRDNVAGADCSSTAVANTTSNGFNISATGAAGTAAGNSLRVHITAESEL